MEEGWSGCACVDCLAKISNGNKPRIRPHDISLDLIKYKEIVRF